ncbi:MAG TPA: type II toxin-antitoxin system VapC family toxin [Candidatus Acidoferrales bacterium]|nr:type II toxin-antitoxin system VapC family toxin [Candidatus Acidoferrales bacterium]
MILLDTHVVVWLAQEYQRVSAAAQATIEKAREERGGIAVSDITLLEIALLAARRRVNFQPDVKSTLSEVERRFIVLPITGDIALQALALPENYPKDPADRIIGATAVVEGLTLVTADAQIRKSRAVPTVW